MIRFAHVNVIARDWRKLAAFYQEVFGCEPVPPERDMAGDWLDKAVGLRSARLRGAHLRLPGHGPEGPTLEIFSYDSMDQRPGVRACTPGFSHIAFAVDDVETAADKILARGGQAVGELTRRAIPGAGSITFQYLTDIEGNILELQRWEP